MLTHSHAKHSAKKLHMQGLTFFVKTDNHTRIYSFIYFYWQAHGTLGEIKENIRQGAVMVASSSEVSVLSKGPFTLGTSRFLVISRKERG